MLDPEPLRNVSKTTSRRRNIRRCEPTALAAGHQNYPEPEASAVGSRFREVIADTFLIIVGSSVRAAAQSAVRAGFRPWCIDQFGDRDLVEISADTHTVSDWPNEIESIIQSAPQAKWLYTGALENQPALVEKLSRRWPLCGCNHETLSKLRAPLWLAETLTRASLPCLSVVAPVSNAPDNGEWIIKPLASGAGIGIQDFPGGDVGTDDFSGHYLQRKARGRVISGLFLGTRVSAFLIGLCEQLCRGSDAGENRYVYAGSLGPLSTVDISDDVFEQAQRIGTAIEASVRAEGASLTGLFGIDFVLDEETSELWTLEINPRYTASVEIYERAFGWPLMRWHVDACRRRGGDKLAAVDFRPYSDQSLKHGKIVVYAECEFTAPDIVPLVERLSVDGLAPSRIEVADIPRLGTFIRKDEPVCTLLAAHENLSSCREVLIATSRELLIAIGEVA